MAGDFQSIGDKYMSFSEGIFKNEYLFKQQAIVNEKGLSIDYKMLPNYQRQFKDKQNLDSLF